jgi:hypothetical protein
MDMRTKKSFAGSNLLILLVMIACLLGYSQQARAQQVVYPTNSYLVDPGAVQAAVNQGGTVLLKATDLNGTPTPFNFGEPVTWASAGNVLNNSRRVSITKDVKIFGEKDHKGNPLTKIKGGVLSFFSPLPASPYPAPDITIEGIHFDGAFYAPILIRYASGLKIVGNRIENVHPFAVYSFPLNSPPVPVIFMDRIDGLSHHLRIQQGISIGSPFAAYVPGALTGIIEVSDNVMDLTIDSNVYNQPILPHSPRNTFGEGIFAGFTTGASIVISGNYITNCSRNQIEVFDTYLGAAGQGSVLIERNTVITPEDGIANPSKFCPNGIIAGWVMNPPASNDPTKNPKYTISHNYVENKSTRQGIGIFALSDGAVIEKNEVIVTGNSTNPGSGGSPLNIPINRGLSIASDNCYVGQNRIVGEGEYAMTFIPINQYQTASSNVCVGNNVNNFNPNNLGAHLYFGPGFVLPTGIIVPSASNNTVVGGHGTVIDLGDNNTFKGGYRDLTGSHLTTPGGVGDEISGIKDWWNLPLE